MKISLMKNKKQITTQKIKSHPQRARAVLAFSIVLLLVLSFTLTQVTFARFTKSFTLTDSASVAKFDVSVTMPDEFASVDFFEYIFLSDIAGKKLNFSVSNNGEIDIVCTPHISDGVTYRVLIAEIESPEFTVDAKESVDFTILILPDGLDTNITNAELFLDIHQSEGSVEE